MPGALPVPNAKAIELMIAAGLAFDAEIPAFSKFDRKNYFYPDMPKNYQISQYDMPLTQGGVVHYWLPDGTKKSCRLTRIHLEEDTGKSTHAGSGDGRIAGSSYSLVDFNRAGVPLMECVGEPDIRSAAEAVGYLEALKRTFVELGVSDVKMEEGSLRCDANVSVRLRGAGEYGTKAEIKNMNSFRSVHDAIESEIDRQIAVIESGGRVIQETRGWDEAAGETHSMRSKEQAHDYRYFPEPDLVPLEIDRALIERIRAVDAAGAVRALRALHREIRHLGQADDAARRQPAAGGVLRPRGRDLQRATGGVELRAGRSLASGQRERHLGRRRQGDAGSAGRADRADRSQDGQLEDRQGRARAAVGRRAVRPSTIVESEGLAQVSDPGAIAQFVDDVLAANAESVGQFKAGKENVLRFLVGQVMKASRGKANPELVEGLLREKIAAR